MTHEPASTNDDAPCEAPFRPLAALAFWGSLFAAAGLFAVLALAPKLRMYRELSRDYDRLEHQLIATERRTESLAKVADALEHDPQFAAELARVDFDSPRKEERIAVGPQLSLSVWDSEPASAAAGARPSPAALLDGHLLTTLSDDRTVRLPLMAASSLLVLAAFVLCNERTAKRDDPECEPPRGGLRHWLANRYRKPLSD
jgi:hypothetical protein